jgi:hypothetical protein
VNGIEKALVGIHPSTLYRAEASIRAAKSGLQTNHPTTQPAASAHGKRIGLAGPKGAESPPQAILNPANPTARPQRPSQVAPEAERPGAAPAAALDAERAVSQIQQSVFSKIKSSWGKKEGDEGFDASVDFNADGAINILDYQKFLQSLKADFEALKASWGTAAGLEKFNSACDYNSDGKINILDYQRFIQKWIA